MSNPVFPDLIKIGKSDSDLTVSTKHELETAGVPEPFTVEYYAFVEDHNDILGQVHLFLKI
tara:strand:- start:939 stop:1121 length:183 start_codon:yes stop_codon:yes gene_type:complete